MSLNYSISINTTEGVDIVTDKDNVTDLKLKMSPQMIKLNQEIISEIENSSVANFSENDHLSDGDMGCIFSGKKTNKENDSPTRCDSMDIDENVTIKPMPQARQLVRGISLAH